jgi:hypothetical protein
MTHEHFRVPGEVFHTGVSETSSIGHVSDCVGACKAGEEGAKLQQHGTQVVPVVTLDEFVLAQNLTSIAWLVIDTEGHDALVLRGAMQLLRTRRVGVIEFEYHGIGSWANESIHETINLLHDLGRYECFWQGSGKLSRLLPGCDYEIRTWSNLVCGFASVRKVLRTLSQV